MRVFVYFNVRKNLFSIKALEGANKGRVIAHAINVEVLNATFVVGETGRLRVLATGHKNVHAGVRGRLGYWGADTQRITKMARKVTYNPKRDLGFIYAVSRLPAPLKAERVVLSPTSVYAEI